MNGTTTTEQNIKQKEIEYKDFFLKESESLAGEKRFYCDRDGCKHADKCFSRKIADSKKEIHPGLSSKVIQTNSTGRGDSGSYVVVICNTYEANND